MGKGAQNKQGRQVLLTADEPQHDLHFNLVLIWCPNDQQASIIISKWEGGYNIFILALPCLRSPSIYLAFQTSIPAVIKTHRHMTQKYNQKQIVGCSALLRLLSFYYCRQWPAIQWQDILDKLELQTGCVGRVRKTGEGRSTFRY